MKNRIKYLFGVIIFVSFISNAVAAVIQDENVIQLQFNKTLFVSGEKIWFKSTLASAHEKNQQNILFVDLCGEGSIVASRILVRENEHWQGDITIPDSLETGIYLVRAYTGNFDGNHKITSKLVTVINRFGNNQTNNFRKTIRQNKPIDLIFKIPNETGNFKIFSNSNVYKTKEVIEFTIKKSINDLPSGISFSVFELPDNGFVDTLRQITKPDEEYVEYASSKTVPIFNKLTLSGRITKKNGNEPVKNEMVLFSIPDSIPQINYATTNENGEFCFEIDEYYGQQDVIVQTLTKSEEFKIELFPNLLDPPSRIPFYIPEEIEKSDFVKQAVQRAILQKSYENGIDKAKSKPTFKFPFYGIASNIVIPDRYIELNDFEEIVKEILPLCRLRKQKDNYSLRIADPSVYGYFDSPWILVDGIPISDVKKLIPLNTPKIKRIETQPQIRCYGELLINGVLSVTTTNGNFSDVPLPVNALRTPFNTIYLPVDYKGNSFVSDQNFADFKDVLYWDPMLKSFDEVSKINVQSSYEKGNYVAIVQATDKQGTSHCSIFRFKVE